jgi:hypothetical protein
MKNFTGQKFEIFLKDWTSVIKLKNSNGNAPITLFTPKVDLEKSVPTFKVFIKIVMFDMNRLDIMHLRNKCWRSS